jgi:HEPN domain-containing protein
MRQEVKNWWEQAKNDFEKAEVLYQSGHYDGVAFYSQQAVEKALKSIYLKGFEELKKVMI